MFIHFAFRALGKQGKTEEQTEQVIDFILRNKRLKVNKCTEFIPEFPEPGNIRIPMDKFHLESNGDGSQHDVDLKEMNHRPNEDSIYFLQRDVPMICFIKIAFNQLRASNHSREYGKFGIVLTEKLLKSKGIQLVQYYTEESLWNDPLIMNWNYELKSLPPDKRKGCEKEILTYRKPAKMFPTFKNSVMAKVMAASGGGTVEFIRYNEYPEGYNFMDECEYRIAFDEGVDYLCFDEGDLFMIIAPDADCKNAIETFFHQNWKWQPLVKIYPS